jgi:hypothetical protein
MDERKKHAKAIQVVVSFLVFAVIASGPALAAALAVGAETGLTGETGLKGETIEGGRDAADAKQTGIDPRLTERPGLDIDPQCLEVSVVGFAASPSTIPFNGNAVLSWDVRVPRGCATRIDLNGAPVPLQASVPVFPQHPGTHHYRLFATAGLERREIAVAPLEMGGLGAPVAGARQTVHITGNHPGRLVYALGIPRTTVILAEGVEVDLSYREHIVIANGVELYGNRARLDPGPLVYTSTRPSALFTIQGEATAEEGTVEVNPSLPPVRVRIAGLRIQGPDMDSVDKDTKRTFGVVIDSCERLGAAPLDVEIYNNEIYGWNGAAVRAIDRCNRMQPGEVPPPFTSHAVRIHDNYIHHNQHTGGPGYGVALGPGAYALVEHNVFDWNRHAIEADGAPGTGYVARGNLVLANGGYHDSYPVVGDIYTHQFDMHGTDNCGVPSIFSDNVWNCGAAGHSVYIRQNTFLNTKGAAIKLRGTPEVGMFVSDNVFAHTMLIDVFLPNFPLRGAMAQTEGGLIVEPGNLLAIDGSTALGSCDFDNDDVPDSFMATGVTWWYSSGGHMPWVYLNASPERLHEVALGDYDGDGVCDVAADGRYSSGGTEPWRRIQGVPQPVDSGKGLLTR